MAENKTLQSANKIEQLLKQQGIKYSRIDKIQTTTFEIKKTGYKIITDGSVIDVMMNNDLLDSYDNRVGVADKIIDYIINKI